MSLLMTQASTLLLPEKLKESGLNTLPRKPLLMLPYYAGCCVSTVIQLCLFDLCFGFDTTSEVILKKPNRRECLVYLVWSGFTRLSEDDKTASTFFRPLWILDLRQQTRRLTHKIADQVSWSYEGPILAWPQNINQLLQYKISSFR